DQYQKFLHEAAVILGVPANSEKLSHDIEQLIHFERKLFNISQQFSEEKSLSGTFEALQLATHNRVNWVDMANRIRRHMDLNIPLFNASQQVECRYCDYIDLLVEAVNTSPIEVVQNFFAWQLVINYGPLTTGSLRRVIDTFTIGV